jgi:peptidoglycan/xylan/chitin deacetylase (PgdA/CDA1 family)
MRKALKRALVLALFYSGMNWVCETLMRDRAYLVGYHNIGDRQNPTAFDADKYPKVTINADVFEKHLAYLQRHGHTFVSLQSILDGDVANVSKPTLIYFDDGFKSVEAYAAPILKRFNAPATVFITSGVADRLPDIQAGVGTGAIEKAYLSWDDMRRMAASRVFSFGAHGRTHAKMTACTPEELAKELSEPRERIFQELGARPETLAYPHGRVNSTVEAAVKAAGYRLAISSIEGSNTFTDLKRRPLCLKKIAPKPYDDLLMFKIKLYSWNLVLGFSRGW